LVLRQLDGDRSGRGALPIDGDPTNGDYAADHFVAKMAWAVEGGSNRGLNCAVGFATRQQIDQFFERRVPRQNSLLR